MDVDQELLAVSNSKSQPWVIEQYSRLRPMFDVQNVALKPRLKPLPLLADISSKMVNVSNRDNHDGAVQFLRDFRNWTPAMGVIHPHPWGRKVFRFISRVPNTFGVDLSWIDNI